MTANLWDHLKPPISFPLHYQYPSYYSSFVSTSYHYGEGLFGVTTLPCWGEIPEVTGREFDGAEMFTGFLNHAIQKQLRSRLQVQVPARNLCPTERYMLRGLISDLHESGLRVRVALKPSTSSEVLADDGLEGKTSVLSLEQSTNSPAKPSGSTFEVQLMQKFRSGGPYAQSIETERLPPEYIELKINPDVMVQIGKTPRFPPEHIERDINPDVMVHPDMYHMNDTLLWRTGSQEWKVQSTLKEWVARLEGKQLARDKQIIWAFSDEVPKYSSEAEAIFNTELKKRILRYKLDRTKPIDPELWNAVPQEIKDLIWTFAVHGSQTPRFFPHITSSRLPWINENHVLDHIVVSKSHSEAVRKATFINSVFVMKSPIKAERFLQNTPAASLSLMSHLEVDFEPDLMLKFLQPHLGFTFGRSSNFLTWLCPTQSVDSFLGQVTAIAGPNLSLVIRMPPRLKMSRARMGASCHLMLCRWVVKAWEIALTQYPLLRKRVKYISDMHEDEKPVRKAFYDKQLKTALEVKDDPKSWPWTRLLQDSIDEFGEAVEGSNPRAAPQYCTCRPPPFEEGEKTNVPKDEINDT